MIDRKSREHACDQSIFRLSPTNVKRFHFIAVVIGVIGVVFGVIGALYEFGRVLPKERQLQLNIATANLAAQEKPDITSPFIHNNLKRMHQENFPMSDIAVPGTIFYMAKFENAGWQRVDMRYVEFTCNDQAYDKIDDWGKGDPKIPLCTLLRKVDFTGASLRKAEFNYTDLREADFTAASLSKARIHDSFVSDAKFLKGISLRGIDIKNSDFTNAQFSPNAKFRCTVMNKKCVKLRRSDFSSAGMNDVLFRGAKIEEVDFTGAQLEGARFDCESDRNSKKPCTALKNVCVQGAKLAGARFKDSKISNVNFTDADLSKARFKDSKISNADFTDADLTGARFKNVEFDRVVLTKEQEKAAKKFDKESSASLDNARIRREEFVLEYPDKNPCSEDWNDDIKEWKDPFSLSKRRTGMAECDRIFVALST